MEEIYDYSKLTLKRVVVIGPESTGKSTLAASLAKHYATEWVPEYARQYVDRLDRDYKQSDLLEITKGQLASELNKEQKAKRILIYDTNLLVLKIWSDYKYGSCDPEIIKKFKEKKYDLYLLTYIDVPWEDDSQREHPKLRKFFYSAYKSELEAFNLPYVEIRGEFFKRKKESIEAIDSLVL